MLVYKPNTILIPDNILQHESVSSQLLKNMDGWMISPYSGLTRVYRATNTRGFVNPSVEEKREYLRKLRKVAYFYDVFLSLRKNERCYLIAIIANQPLN